MAFYESEKSSPSFFKTKITTQIDFSFPLHFHSSFELLYVREGKIEVTVDRKVYRPSAGTFVLIPPNAAHSYRSQEYSKISILIFNETYLTEIYEETKIGIYRDPVIPNSEELFYELKESENNLFLLKSVLYRIAAKYAENTVFSTVSLKDEGFVATFSEYLERHYSEQISEITAAKELGYHPRYLSYLIHKGFGTSFCRMLNDYRIRAACNLLQNTNHTVTEIYFAVGFESQSSFNRNFKSVMGVTPMKYRQGYLIGRQNHEN